MCLIYEYKYLRISIRISINMYAYICMTTYEYICMDMYVSILRSVSKETRASNQSRRRTTVVREVYIHPGSLSKKTETDTTIHYDNSAKILCFNL